MKFHPDIYHRRSIRLKEFDYSQAGWYFITVCTKGKEPLLGSIENGVMNLSEIGKIVFMFRKEIPKHFSNVILDEFVIMPNHLHGIVGIIDDKSVVGAIHELPLQNRLQRRRMLLPKVIGYFKMNSAKAINQILNTPGKSFWQRNYYEHIIRSEIQLNAIREYIRDNPVNWETDEENVNSRIKSKM